MTPPRSDDNNETECTARVRNEPSKDNDDLVQSLGDLTEDDLAAVLKRLNIDIVKQETRERDQDDADAATTGSSTRFSRTTTSNVMPSRYVKVSTGLKLCSASRTGSELGDVKIVIPKIYRGDKLHDRQKTKKIVTTPLSPKITGSNIAKILSLADSESYDIAEDASQWSTSIKEIYNHAIK